MISVEKENVNEFIGEKNYNNDAFVVTRIMKMHLNQY